MSPELVATYRLQLRSGFRFEDATGVASYLSDLGISHIYTSPYLQAASGSDHGYDVVDPNRVNDELGGVEGHGRFIEAIKAHGLGHVLDIVPNHMSIATHENKWWWDVLENGRSSRYAAYFDIYWEPRDDGGRDVIVLPVLGTHLPEALQAGKIRLQRDGTALTVRYYDSVWPLSLSTVAEVLASAARACHSEALASLAEDVLRCIHGDGIESAGAASHMATRVEWRDRLVRLFDESPRFAQALDSVLAKASADLDALGELLDRQHYRLAYWGMAAEELGYRRFFDINTLAGLRM